MKKSVIIGMLTFFVCPDITAQMPDSIVRTVDSLIQIRESSSGRAKYDATFRIAYELFDIDNVTALKYAEEAVQLAGQSSDSSLMVTSGRLYGQLLRRAGRLDEAIKVMVPLTFVAARNNYAKDLRFLHNALAIAYTFRGQYDYALEQNFKSLRLREQQKDAKEISIALGNIASTFYLMGIFDRSAEFFESALQTDSLNSFTIDMKVSLALCYFHLNYLSKSKQLIMSLNQRHHHQLSDHTLTRIHYGLGRIALAEGNPLSAIENMRRSYALAVQTSNKVYMADCFIEFAKIQLYANNVDSARYFFNKGDLLSREIRYRNGVESSNLGLLKIFEAAGDIEKISKAQSVLLAIKDSTINQSTVNTLARLQYDYYEAQNSRTIANQAQLLILQQKSLKLYSILGIVSTLCTILLIVVAILLYRSFKIKRERAMLLEDRVRERTSELARYSSSVHHSNLERKYLVDALSTRIGATLATLRGLGAVARTYEHIPMELVVNLEAAVEALADVHQLINSKKSRDLPKEFPK